MKTRTKIILGLLALAFLFTLIEVVTSMDVTFYHSDTCPHCQTIKPFIEQQYNHYKDYNWSFYEISTPLNYEKFKSNGFQGVPAFVINTDDGREIKFTGADKLRLHCETQQMSDLDCETKTSTKDMQGSLFAW